MKSFIMLATNISYIISRRPTHAGITVVSTRRKSIKSMLITRIRSKLNELLSPIKDSGCNDHVESVFPIQRTFHKRKKADSQISQSKEVTPEKLGCLLKAFHRACASDHYISSTLRLHVTTTFIKNVKINASKLLVCL